MRTLWIIIGGVALWAVCLGASKLIAGQDPAAMMTRATLIFLLLWLLLAGLNLYVGVTRAGYTLREELPIFLLIFALPAVLALLVRWKIR
jgi:hypothetical protein